MKTGKFLNAAAAAATAGQSEAVKLGGKAAAEGIALAADVIQERVQQGRAEDTGELSVELDIAKKNTALSKQFNSINNNILGMSPRELRKAKREANTKQKNPLSTKSIDALGLDSPDIKLSSDHTHVSQTLGYLGKLSSVFDAIDNAKRMFSKYSGSIDSMSSSELKSAKETIINPEGSKKSGKSSKASSFAALILTSFLFSGGACLKRQHSIVINQDACNVLAETVRYCGDKGKCSDDAGIRLFLKSKKLYDIACQ